MKPRAIVLAAGKGVRLKSDKPKVLHSILGRPLIRHVLDTVEATGIEDITIVVGHGAAEIKKVLGGQYRYVPQTELNGTGDAVTRCKDAFKNFQGSVLVLCGDAPLIPRAAMEGMMRLTDEKNAACILFTACLEDPRGYGRVVRDRESGRFLKIAEDINASEEEKYIFESNSGAYCFRATDLFAALEKVQPDDKKGEYYLTEVPRILSEEGKTVETLRAQDPSEVFGINNRRDLVAATNFLRWRIMEHHMDNGVTVVDPSTTMIEADVEIGQDSIVEPFCILRSGTRIGKNCHVGPFAHLRGNTTLMDRAEIGNFVEVKNSRIGLGSKAKHLAYLGDAELGAKVNIGAGTITANYDGKNKHKTQIGDGVHTGSNTVLIAPVTLGKGAKTGAGAVVTKEKVEAGSVVVGIPARPISKKSNV